jgi:ubiquinone/menaquinone biosynthesis C-methylase UbiE
MNENHLPLYGKEQACALRKREEYFKIEQRKKFSLILDHLGDCRRLVDIGCGWGQFLQWASRQVGEVWGVDESSDRMRDSQKVCPAAKLVLCRADKLDLPDDYFDAVSTTQMLHEIKLFGGEGELDKVLREIYRVLAPGGRYFLLDHRDAGDGFVTVRLPEEKISQLLEYEGKYNYYPAVHEECGDGRIRISKRGLQDFLTKTWSLKTDMEEMEMNETHNVFEQTEISQRLESAGFTIETWIPFSDIREDLKSAGGELITGEPWLRKFLLIAAGKI